ncbi:MAG TPA: hypothetical protein PKD28_03860 [Candidatus Saccharibacteria bacterium]|nr:hypothetical protein [Candidatus Saccharibacteria bacterium]
MTRFFAQSLLTLLGNALGLLAAALLLSDFHITGVGFVVSVGFFTVTYILFAPFILKMAIKYAPAFRGGIALVTTLAALILTVIFTDGLQIGSATSWAVAPLIIWLVTVLAGIILPLFLFKKLIGQKTASRKKVPSTLE